MIVVTLPATPSMVCRLAPAPAIASTVRASMWPTQAPEVTYAISLVGDWATTLSGDRAVTYA